MQFLDHITQRREKFFPYVQVNNRQLPSNLLTEVCTSCPMAWWRFLRCCSCMCWLGAHLLRRILEGLCSASKTHRDSSCLAISRPSSLNCLLRNGVRAMSSLPSLSASTLIVSSDMWDRLLLGMGSRQGNYKWQKHLWGKYKAKTLHFIIPMKLDSSTRLW
jgi:hypothetical protein